MPPVQAPQPGDRIGPPPLADLLPAGMIIGWEVPDGMDERAAVVIQACACGVTAAAAGLMVNPSMSQEAVQSAKQRYRAYYELLRARTEVIFRSMLAAGQFSVVKKLTDAAHTLAAPASWEEARTASQVGQALVSLMGTFADTPATTQRARAKVDDALKRLESMQRVEGASVKADSTNNAAQVEIEPITDSDTSKAHPDQ